MSTAWPLRSLLFVPAHRPELVSKAIRSGTDAVILDLEDSVPLSHKAVARSQIRTEVAELSEAGVAALVRLNATGDHLLADVDVSVAPGLTALILPKAESAAQIRMVDKQLSYCEGREGMPCGAVTIVPLPETVRGLQDAEELAAASSRVSGILGTISGKAMADVALALGFTPSIEGSEQLYMNSKLVLDSRAGGASFPIAGVFGTQLNDLETVEKLVRRAKALGYTGCPVMHPSHVAVVNRVFTPTLEEFQHSLGMIEAFAEAEGKGLGAISYKGMMVDYAMLPLARQIVAEYQWRNAIKNKQ